MAEQEFYSPPQLAELAGVSHTKIYELIERGDLRAVNLSYGLTPRWRISLNDWRAFLDSRSSSQPNSDAAHGYSVTLEFMINDNGDCVTRQVILPFPPFPKLVVQLLDPGECTILDEVEIYKVEYCLHAKETTACVRLSWDVASFEITKEIMEKHGWSEKCWSTRHKKVFQSGSSERVSVDARTTS